MSDHDALMIYTEEENRRWWQSLTKVQKYDILELMAEKSNSITFHRMVKDILHKVDNDFVLSSDELAEIRKWEH